MIRIYLPVTLDSRSALMVKDLYNHGTVTMDYTDAADVLCTGYTMDVSYDCLKCKIDL